MSQKEAERLHIIKQLLSKQIKLQRAAELMNISYRQAKRIKRSYICNGVKGLISKKRGKPSPNKISDEVIQKAASIIKEKYYDFGPTLVKEKLEENHNIEMSVETIRNVMIENNIWINRKHKKVIIHQMRSRRSRFGELIQIDESYHKWFKDRSDSCCLIVFIDDATSKITSARFCEHETTLAYLATLKSHINKYGKPISFDNNKMDDSYFFQFTHSLIISSIYQAINTDSSIKGFIDLDQNLQDTMVKRFEEYKTVENYI